MHELKLFIVRLVAAALLVAFCLGISRAADTHPLPDSANNLSASSVAVLPSMQTGACQSSPSD